MCGVLIFDEILKTINSILVLDAPEPIEYYKEEIDHMKINEIYEFKRRTFQENFIIFLRKSYATACMALFISFYMQNWK